MTRAQLAGIQETVDHLPHESRTERAKVICEHLSWTTARGDYKVQACLHMLAVLEAHQIVTLPARRARAIGANRVETPVWTSDSDPQPPIPVALSDLQPIRLERVADRAGRQLWNAFVARYHYLGHRKPFGAYLRYFLMDRDGRRLGCLLFETATHALPCRDAHIGWTVRQRARYRPRLIQNARFVIFPWVTVPNLASCALGVAAWQVQVQVADDWEQVYHVRPVACETFVETRRFTGACYRAANWQRIGETQPKGKPRKTVYCLPLHPAYKAILCGQIDRTVTTPPSRAQTRAQKERGHRRDGQPKRIDGSPGSRRR